MGDRLNHAAPGFRRGFLGALCRPKNDRLREKGRGVLKRALYMARSVLYGARLMGAER